MNAEILNKTEKELVEAIPDDAPFARDALDLVNDAGLIEPPTLIAGLLHKGSTLLLGASSKSFKSWSLIDMAVSVASGANWWDLPCTKGRVLYADFELTPFFWRKRAMEIAQARGLTLDGIRVMNCRGHDATTALLSGGEAATCFRLETPSSSCFIDTIVRYLVEIPVWIEYPFCSVKLMAAFFPSISRTLTGVPLTKSMELPVAGK